MKKAGILMLVVLISLGIIVVMGGCGGGGSSSLPKSSPSYAGSNLPAVIDSTTVADFFMVPWDLEGVMEEVSLDEVVDSEEGTVYGSYNGSYTYWYKAEEWITDTKDSFRLRIEETFDDYWDDGTTLEGLYRADGGLYMEETGEIRYSGELTPEGIGEELGMSMMYHQNFSDLYFSDESNEQERSGWSTVEANAEDELFIGPWDFGLGADIAFYDYDEDFFLALLDAEADLAWDGTFTTYVGEGTVCVEGNAEYPVIGCFDVAFDMTWDENGEGAPVEDYPIDGWMEVSTLGASAMFAYGTSPSDETCVTISVDENGDEVYDWVAELCGLAP